MSFIQETFARDEVFNITAVTEHKVYNELKNLNEKKATRHDMVPPRQVKMPSKQLSRPILYLVHESLRCRMFLDMLKRSLITLV